MTKQNNKTKKSFFSFMIYFIVKVRDDDIFALGAQLAYYLILSFFPFLIFLFTLVGFSSLDSMQIIEGLSTILPSTVLDLISSIVVEVFDSQRSGLLGASIILTIWIASSAFRAVIKGINKAYNIEETRSFITRAFVAIISMIALALIIMTTLALLVFGQIIGNIVESYVHYGDIIQGLWNILRYVIVIIMMIFVLGGIYRYAPSKKIPWSETIPGAVFGTLCWIIVSLCFSFYVNNYNDSSRVYGSLASVFVLMTWLYISSIIVIIGGEINSVLSMTKNKRNII